MLSINNNTAFNFARILLTTRGIPAGISSGAAVAAAVELMKNIEMKNKNTVIIIPSFAEVPLNTIVFRYKVLNEKIKTLNDHELEKFSRQIILEKVGETGQLKILNSSILIVGCGGLGSTAAVFIYEWYFKFWIS